MADQSAPSTPAPKKVLVPLLNGRQREVDDDGKTSSGPWTLSPEHDILAVLLSSTKFNMIGLKPEAAAGASFYQSDDKMYGQVGNVVDKVSAGIIALAGGVVGNKPNVNWTKVYMYGLSYYRDSIMELADRGETTEVIETLEEDCQKDEADVTGALPKKETLPYPLAKNQINPGPPGFRESIHYYIGRQRADRDIALVFTFVGNMPLLTPAHPQRRQFHVTFAVNIKPKIARDIPHYHTGLVGEVTYYKFPSSNDFPQRPY